jgi:site-specific DNA-methyltransferase (adenine-specific)
MTDLCQFFTPAWVAEALIERHFPRLDCADLVLEPTCGKGAFLQALPRSVPAIGVEIDLEIAAQARAATGREIITGDFRTVPIDFQPTAIIGNPPFRADVFDEILDRSHALLPEGARAGFILPAYFFQTAQRVAKYGDRWSLLAEMMPRTAFHYRMRTPLMFTVFSKDRRNLMIGLALYREAADVQKFGEPYRSAINGITGSVWRAVSRIALQQLGGEADLQDIYREIEPNRPTRTKFWREKIRQVLRINPADFMPLGRARYALAGAGG